MICINLITPVEEKLCNTCDQILGVDKFSSPGKWNCISCVKAKESKRSKAKYLRHRDKKREYHAKYRKENKERIALYHKEHREKNREELNRKSREKYLEKDKEALVLYRKEHREKNKEELNRKARERYYKNIEERRRINRERQRNRTEKTKEYRNKNRARRNANEQRRKRENVNVRLGYNLRSRLLCALKRGNVPRKGSAVRDLGCSVEFLKEYIESKFQPGMTWDNWSRTGWHIDHIKPLASFDLTDRDQFLLANHYTNLQPLWAKDNLQKGYQCQP